MNRKVAKLLKKASKSKQEYQKMKEIWEKKSAPEKARFWETHARDKQILNMMGRRKIQNEKNKLSNIREGESTDRKESFDTRTEEGNPGPTA